MKIIEVGERNSLLPDTTVKGVELDGVHDALLLAKGLGSIAAGTLNLRTSELVRELTFPLGLEALRLQQVLLEQVGGIGDPAVPFTFVAVDGPKSSEEVLSAPDTLIDPSDGKAGRVLRNAVDSLSRVPIEDQPVDLEAGSAVIAAL